MKNFNVTEHFSFHELTTTNHLEYLMQNDIEAVPYIINMYNFLTNVVEPIRTFFDTPFRVTSGFRCEGLNRIVGGKDDSLHTKGKALDFTIKGLNWERYGDVCNYIYITRKFVFGKLIREIKNGKIWIHIQDGKEGLYFDGVNGKDIQVK